MKRPFTIFVITLVIAVVAYKLMTADAPPKTLVKNIVVEENVATIEEYPTNDMIAVDVYQNPDGSIVLRKRP